MQTNKIYKVATIVFLIIAIVPLYSTAQNHPRIYINQEQKDAFLQRLEDSPSAAEFVQKLKEHVDPYVEQHQTDPEWIVSRLQMYWKTKYEKVYVNGMDFSHGEGSAPVPTVRFSGSRDWATDYNQPDLEDVLPYMDDERGLYLQNKEKEGKPWEWVQPSETGHIIERINERIIELAEDAAFLYWLTGEEDYAVFARDIFMKYMVGMYYREAPLTFEDHKNEMLMGLQTFEVIHERIVEHLAVCYDFLYGYLKEDEADFNMIHDVFRRWADQEIKYGVPYNNWNLMQALYITYIALVLENDDFYEDGKGQQHYLDQVLNQNSLKQKALKDVVENYDQETGVWPEVAGYNMLVANDMLEVFCLMDNSLNNNLLEQYPIIEKANLVIFQYLFPNGYTVAYGDAKHSRIRFNALEMLIEQYRKYENTEKESLVTAQLKRFIEDGAYSRDEIRSLFQLFFYVEDLMDVPAAASFSDLTTPTFYAPNVSWIVQRNGNSMENGMMISENASLGNHSHTNGINIELYAKGLVIAPDGAAGVSYWSQDHIDYYSRFPAHNTVVVDGISDYRNMRGTQAFEVNAIYPATGKPNPLNGDFTFSDVSFIEPHTDALQQRVIGTVRTSENHGYFVDIFRSARKDGQDKKHEYLFHGQGDPVSLMDFEGESIATKPTDELSSSKGDLVGYDYYKEKKEADFEGNFKAQFSMPSLSDNDVKVNLWMKGEDGRTLFSVESPYSRAINRSSVPEALYHKPLPTLVVRQDGEARTKPFVAIIDAFNEEDDTFVKEVSYFSPKEADLNFVGIKVQSGAYRVDHIFNDEKGLKTHEFQEGNFKGKYGIVSYEGEKLHSIFIGNGQSLELGSWKIDAFQPDGAVLVEVLDGDQIMVESAQPFALTMPIDSKAKGKIELATSDDAGMKNYSGEIIKVKKQKFARFELPAITNTTFELKK